MLPSGHWDGVGTPESGFRGSITRPTSPSVNASPASSQTPTHDPRSPWIATPSMQDVLMSLLQAGLSRRSPVRLPAPPPAGRHRVQRGTPRPVPVGIGVEDRSAPPPAPWPPPSARSGQPRWGRALHTAILSRRCAAWALISGGSLYELAIFCRQACSAAGVKVIHSRPASPRRAGRQPCCVQL